MLQKAFIILVIFLFPLLASAKEQGDSAKTTIEEGDEFMGLSLWGGLDVGGGHLASDDGNDENSKNGFLIGSKAVLSLHSRGVVLDLGLGYSFSRFAGTEEAEARDPGEDKVIDKDSIETRAGIVEFAGRIRRGNFEFGPVAQVMFGTDTTFSPAVVGEEVNEDPNFFIGGGILFGDHASDKLDHRYGAQLMTDLSIDGRQVWLAALQYYIGVPLYSNRSKVKVVERVVTKTKIKNRNRYVISIGYINFTTGSFQVSPEDSAYLAAVGKYLNENEDQWSVILLSSHTDPRGSKELNEKLSMDRANSVKSLLSIKNPKRVVAKSLASKSLISEDNSTVSLARNRRVEIDLIGSKKSLRLKRQINRLQQLHRKPPTCDGSSDDPRCQ